MMRYFIPLIIIAICTFSGCMTTDQQATINFANDFDCPEDKVFVENTKISHGAYGHPGKQYIMVNGCGIKAVYYCEETPLKCELQK